VRHVDLQADDYVPHFQATLFVKRPTDTAYSDSGEDDEAGNSVPFFSRHGNDLEELTDLRPSWLDMIGGVIDSPDLHNDALSDEYRRALPRIHEYLIKECVELLASIAQAPQDYMDFHEEYGGRLRAGYEKNPSLRPAIMQLMRFHSSASGDGIISLTDYVNRMTKGQKNIYAIAAPFRETAAAIPSVKRARANGFEVLYLDAADLAVLHLYGDFEGKQFTLLST